MKKLFTPGPTEVPSDVLAALSTETMHHRTDEFRDVMQEISEGLAYTFRTKTEPVTFTSSGSGAMEAVVAGLFSPGEKVLAVVAGKFGERWRDISRAYGLDVTEYAVKWGTSPDPGELRSFAKENGPFAALFLTQSETSTGTLQDVAAIAALFEGSDTLLIVDAVTALGVHELLPDDWGLDAVVAGSQKAFMCPPGLGFAWLSERAWERTATSTLPKYYFSLTKAKESLSKYLTPYTPAVPLFLALRQSLARMRDEGMDAIWKRHDALGRGARAGVRALGLSLFSEAPANGVTAVLAPPDIGGDAIRADLLDAHGFRLAGGQSHLKDKIFRIGHLGFYETADIADVLRALESVLSKRGWSDADGSAVKAAEAEWK